LPDVRSPNLIRLRAVPRILHIIPTFARAGAENQLLVLASGLPRDEFDVHVCALMQDGPLLPEFRAAGIPATIIGQRMQADPVTFTRLLLHIRRLRPDLVHTWLFEAGSYGRAAARLAGVKCLVAGEYRVDRWKSAWQWSAELSLKCYTDRYVTNSAAVRDRCARRGLPADRFVVIPNGVAPARPSDLSRAELLGQLQCPSDARLIGVVGPLFPQKRVKDLIWAADLLRVLHNNLRLLIIGDGPERFVLERFARLASDLDHIRFLGQRNDVWRIMPHLDAFWNGGAGGGQANALMEAMAAGVPVVASDIESNRELVIPGQTGFLVPVAGRAARARATDQIFTDPALAARLGNAARERMARHFTIEQNIARHAELYREVLG
jgi:glycosyltransferase involved in cell wall biosynthesis